MVWKWLIWVKTPYFEALYLNKKCTNEHDSKCSMLGINSSTSCRNFELWKKISKKSCSCVEWIIMVFLNQILFKYYENLGISYILYYLNIHQKELKSIQLVLLNPGALLLFVARSMLLCSSTFHLISFTHLVCRWCCLERWHFNKARLFCARTQQEWILACHFIHCSIFVVETSVYQGQYPVWIPLWWGAM